MVRELPSEWCQMTSGQYSRRVNIFSHSCRFRPNVVRFLCREPKMALVAPGRFPKFRTGEKKMRVMVMVKATEESEAGVMPGEQLLTDMMKFNEELVNAGVMLAGEGLHPSSKAKRVRFSGAKRTVIDGPFPETKELIAGYWIWKVNSIEEAVDWVKRCPNPMNSESDIDIRPIFEAEDFGAELTPELKEQEDRLRSKIEEQAK